MTIRMVVVGPCCLLLAAWTMLSGSSGLASPPAKPSAEALVILVANGEILVDLGTEHGVRAGQKGELLSRVSLKHPVTGVQIDDLVPLVGVAVKSAGTHVAVLTAPEESFPRIRVKDVVRFPGLLPVEPAQPEIPETIQVDCPACTDDPEAMKVHTVWLETIGRSTEERRALWATFVTTNPTSPYRMQAAREVTFLNQLERGVGRAAFKGRKKANNGVVVNHRPLRRVGPGTPVRPVALIISEARMRKVKLFFRSTGERLYDHMDMHQMGDVSYRGRIPPALVNKDGFEYFIEAQTEDGKRVKVAGTVKEPVAVVVDSPPHIATDVAGRSRAHASVEWADFYLNSPGTDSFVKVEGDYLYRMKGKHLYAFRMGVGIFDGQGGPVEWVEDPAAYEAETGEAFVPSRLALTYSYFEPEFVFSDYVHVMPRLVVGVIREREEQGGSALQTGESVLGFHTYMRIGKEMGTNLVLGGSFTQEMGLEGLVEMNLNIFSYFPVGISVAATNWPVQENYAARLGFKLGWRQFDWMSIDCLLGVNMRNIRHIGMGGGAGLSFNW